MSPFKPLQTLQTSRSLFASHSALSAPILTVATYNIHKGFSHFNRNMVVHAQRDRLRALGADVVFLQEVVGHNAKHVKNHPTWPNAPQHEFFAERDFGASAYGKNAVYGHGHHGNALLSRHPILRAEQIDISTNRLEQRGLLHAVIQVSGWPEPLHCVCVHLGLFARSRSKQVASVCERIEALVPHNAPLVLAGDFNDWRHGAGSPLALLGVHDVFETLRGRPARSFPSRLPILRLDRIYIRGLQAQNANVHRGHDWAKLSDHAPLVATLTLA